MRYNASYNGGGGSTWRGAAPWEKLRIRITGARIGNEIGVVIKDDGAGAVVGCYSSSSSSSRLRAKVAEDQGLRSEGCVRSRTLTASAYIDLPEDNAR